MEVLPGSRGNSLRVPWSQGRSAPLWDWRFLALTAGLAAIRFLGQWPGGAGGKIRDHAHTSAPNTHTGFNCPVVQIVIGLGLMGPPRWPITRIGLTLRVALRTSKLICRDFELRQPTLRLCTLKRLVVFWRPKACQKVVEVAGVGPAKGCLAGV